MSLRQVQELRELVDLLEAGQAPHRDEEDVVRIIVRPTPCLRHLGDGDSDARLVHHDVVLHSGGEVVADVGRQGVVLAVPGLLLLHVTKRTSADTDLTQKRLP